MRVVCDTNVLFAAMVARGLCADLLIRILEAHQLVLSPYIIDELSTNLARKTRLASARIDSLAQFLRYRAELVQPMEVEPHACRDPDDLPILGTVIAAQADLLVTGDKDLLILEQVAGIPILNPRDCFKELR